MSLFTINDEQCNRDGICADVCPVKIIGFKENEPPFPLKNADALCIECGHCVAICPKEAFENKNIGASEFSSVQGGLSLTPEQVEYFVRSRRSIRAYKDKVVDRETIEKILNIAAYAPTGHNAQEVYWSVITGKERILKLVETAVDWMNSMLEGGARFEGSDLLKHCVMAWGKGVDVVCREAPHVIVAHSPKENPTGDMDCIIALTHLDLIAPSFGLGTCWAGILNMGVLLWPPMQEVLVIPEGHKYYGGMMLGYPNYKYKLLPPRSKAKVTWGG